MAAPMIPGSHSYITRGHDLRLHKSRAKYDLRKYFFSNRVVNIWNFLPGHVVNADTVNCFKSRLDKFWANQEPLGLCIISEVKFMEREAEVK